MNILEILRRAAGDLWEMDESQLQAVAPDDRKEVVSLLSRVLSAGHSLQDAVCDWEVDDEEKEEGSEEPRDFVVEQHNRIMFRAPDDPDSEH